MATTLSGPLFKTEEDYGRKSRNHLLRSQQQEQVSSLSEIKELLLDDLLIIRREAGGK